MPALDDRFASAVIGGFAGIIAALGVVTVHTGVGGIDAGDVLQFTGGVMGSGLAVAGALWVERRRRALDAVEGARPVLDALLRLEDKSRDFFGEPDAREEHAVAVRLAMSALRKVQVLSPPRTARLIAHFNRLNVAADFLTGEVYLEMNRRAPMRADPERSRVERMLEAFDGPLKLLIVEYARMVDPDSTRAVRHMGEMPDP